MGYKVSIKKRKAKENQKLVRAINLQVKTLLQSFSKLFKDKDYKLFKPKYTKNAQNKKISHQLNGTPVPNTSIAWLRNKGFDTPLATKWLDCEIRDLTCSCKMKPLTNSSIFLPNRSPLSKFDPESPTCTRKGPFSTKGQVNITHVYMKTPTS